MNGVCFLPLSQGDWASVDLIDAARSAEHKWSLKIKGSVYDKKYAYRTGGQHLHQFIVAEKGLVDHIDGDGLNNRRNNLRFATSKENGRNLSKWKTKTTSAFKGVSFRKSSNSWRAYVYTDGRQTHLGMFETEELAARAYDKKCVELFGEFARPNFP
jgi:hypothetical protein